MPARAWRGWTAAVAQCVLACSPAPAMQSNNQSAGALAGFDENAAGANAESPLPAVSGTLAGEFLAAAPDDWSTLIAVRWNLAAGHDSYLCVRATVPRDAYLHEFALVATRGTHHVDLIVNEAPTGPDGVVACTVDRSGRQIYDSNDASSGEAGHWLLPDGIALPLHAGQQLLLNVHVLNTDDERLSGTSGVLVRSLAQSAVEQLGQVVWFGPLQLQIPPGSGQQQARCTVPYDTTVFGVSPHMHELGTRMKLIAERSIGGDIVLFDDAYNFDAQRANATDFIRLRAGDAIHIQCTYQNPSIRTLGFGQTAQDEMCSATLSVFPAHDDAFYACVD